MARRTSIDTYYKIKNEGLLSRRRLQVYEILFQHGPMTSGELYKKRKISFDIENSNSRSRLTELRDMGCVVELGEKKCSITGRNCILWDVTEGLPSKLPKKESRLSRKRLEQIVEVFRYCYKHPDMPANLKMYAFNILNEGVKDDKLKKQGGSR